MTPNISGRFRISHAALPAGASTLNRAGRVPRYSEIRSGQVLLDDVERILYVGPKPIQYTAVSKKGNTPQ